MDSSHKDHIRLTTVLVDTAACVAASMDLLARHAQWYGKHDQLMTRSQAALADSRHQLRQAGKLAPLSREDD